MNVVVVMIGRMVIDVVRRGLVLSAILLAAAPAPIHARPTISRSQEAKIAACIRQAAAGHVWLERTLWGLHDQEGGWIGAEVPNFDGSFDLGPMQVNSWWLERISKVIHRSPKNVRRWLIHDVCFNVRAARWIFLSGLAATGDYWQAIGVYHSPTRWRQQRYGANVAKRLIGRFGSDVFE